MDTKNIKKTLLITAMPFLFAASCRKNTTKPCSSYTPYTFKATSVFSNEKENYQVGDTIFLSSEFSKILIDYTTVNNNIIDYGNSVGIYGGIGIAYLDSISHQPKPAKDSFSFVPLIGNFQDLPINQNKGVSTKYSELQTSYKFNAGFICKKKGIYWISVDELSSSGLANKDCTNATFSMTLLNINKHESLFQNALLQTPSPLALSTMYCFRVN